MKLYPLHSKDLRNLYNRLVHLLIRKKQFLYLSVYQYIIIFLKYPKSFNLDSEEFFFSIPKPGK